MLYTFQQAIMQEENIYYIFTVKYKGFTQDVYVEVEYFDDEEPPVLIPTFLILEYEDEYIERGTMPDLNKLHTRLYFTDDSCVFLDSSEIYLGEVKSDNSGLTWEIGYDYYVEIDGELYYMLATGRIKVFYQ